VVQYISSSKEEVGNLSLFSPTLTFISDGYSKSETISKESGFRTIQKMQKFLLKIAFTQ